MLRLRQRYSDKSQSGIEFRNRRWQIQSIVIRNEGSFISLADSRLVVVGEARTLAVRAMAKANSMLIPGIIMQPSGVFATTLAQENGCQYVRAT